MLKLNEVSALLGTVCSCMCAHEIQFHGTGNLETEQPWSLIITVGYKSFFLIAGVGRLSENMHIIANEPSLALFCIQVCF